MEIIIFLLPMALLLGIFFIGAFIWATIHGQYDDVETPKYRMLLDDHESNKIINPLTRKDEK